MFGCQAKTKTVAGGLDNGKFNVVLGGSEVFFWDFLLHCISASWMFPKTHMSRVAQLTLQHSSWVGQSAGQSIPLLCGETFFTIQWLGKQVQVVSVPGWSPYKNTCNVLQPGIFYRESVTVMNLRTWVDSRTHVPFCQSELLGSKSLLELVSEISDSKNTMAREHISSTE